MRSHAKASSAGSTQRQGKSLGRIVRGAALTRGLPGDIGGSGAPAFGYRRGGLAAASLALALLLLPAAGALAASAPSVVETYATDVIFKEAKLNAKVNPNEAATSYQFQYVDQAHYQPLALNPYAEGEVSPAAPQSIGSGASAVTATRPLEGLTPGTAYHYRVVVTNSEGTTNGPDRMIRTFVPFVGNTACPNQAFRSGAAASLPDCRAYEMVSPVDKNNGDIAELDELQGSHPAALNQSSISGERLAYATYRPFGDAESGAYNSQYIAARGPDGWLSHGISPINTHLIGAGAANLNTEFKALSPDLCQSWLNNFAEPPLAPGALPEVENLYQRQDEECGGTEYEVLTPGHDPVGTEVQGMSADLSHVIFAAQEALTADTQPPFLSPRLYDWTGGQLHYVCILPNGEPETLSCTAGGPLGAVFGGNGSGRFLNVKNAISSDGSRIFWSACCGEGEIYVRIDGTETVAVSKEAEEDAGSEETSRFWAASRDGSKAIFTSSKKVGGSFFGDNLYEFGVDSETTHLIAEKVEGVMGTSDDASRIYFVSREALAAGATANRKNLYFYEAGAGGGEYRFIGELAESTDFQAASLRATERTSAVTPDGLQAAFVSHARLTSYDNTSTDEGFPAGEVYRYDATADGGEGELLCVSCSPSGQRSEANLNNGMSLSAPITNLYSPGVLSDDGKRVFFEGIDWLTPSDTNGHQDVYQWEAPGTGDCDEADPTYAPSDGGCISLVSSGKSVLDSQLVDASPDGGDVFFLTGSSLVPQDVGLADIYDARIDGGFPAATKVAACEGEACQNAPEAPNDPTPGSSSYSGPGNVSEQPAVSRKHKKKHHKRRHAHRRHRANHNRRASR